MKTMSFDDDGNASCREIQNSRYKPIRLHRSWEGKVETFVLYHCWVEDRGRFWLVTPTSLVEQEMFQNGEGKWLVHSDRFTPAKMQAELDQRNKEWQAKRRGPIEETILKAYKAGLDICDVDGIKIVTVYRSGGKVVVEARPEDSYNSCTFPLPELPPLPGGEVQRVRAPRLHYYSCWSPVSRGSYSLPLKVEEADIPMGLRLTQATMDWLAQQPGVETLRSQQRQEIQASPYWADCLFVQAMVERFDEVVFSSTEEMVDRSSEYDSDDPHSDGGRKSYSEKWKTEATVWRATLDGRTIQVPGATVAHLEHLLAKYDNVLSIMSTCTSPEKSQLTPTGFQASR